MADDGYLIACEGSGCPPAGGVVCSMCGHQHPIVDGVVAAHQRTDIIRMISDGVFDGKAGQ